MRLEWEIRWEWKQRNDSETRTIILLVHRVSNARVVKERRGVFAGCYEYNENVSCRFLLSPLPLSLFLSLYAINCVTLPVLYATLLVSISSSRFMLDFES